MKASLISAALFFLIRTSLAAPASTKTGQPAPLPTEPTIITFNLVSTNVSSPSAVEPALNDGHALILFDPYHQKDLLLRTAPNYNLPIFKLEKGSLHVKAPGQFGGKDKWYASQKLVAGKPVTFSEKPNGSSGMSWNGPLISVGESSGFFQLCKGPLGESVIYYKGKDKSCGEYGFLQAVPRSMVL